MYIPDIRNNRNISGDKQIYNIFIGEDDIAYLSCGFGLTSFDLNDNKFYFTCFTGLTVNQTYANENFYIISTEDGLYAFNRKTQSNPADFSQWVHLGQENKLPAIYSSLDVTGSFGNIYMVTQRELWKSDQTLRFSKIFSSGEDSDYAFLSPSAKGLMLGVRHGWGNSRIYFFDAADQHTESNWRCSNKITHAVMDQYGVLWNADETGDIRYTTALDGDCSVISINSPWSASVSDISALDGKLFIAGGGVDGSYVPLYKKDGFFIWDGERWKNYNRFLLQEFENRNIQDLFRILPHPAGEKVFIGSYTSGLIVLDHSTEEMAFYNKTNSTLAGKPGDDGNDRISGLALDDQDNLWISNFGALKPISVFSGEGTWKSFDVQSSLDLRDVIIDQNNVKWFIIDRDGDGVLLYDDRNTPMDESDDQQRILSKSNTNLQSNKVNALKMDLDGNVWVGTEDGPVVFECGSDVFREECKGSRRKTVLEGIPAYVLDDVSITAIEVDGANRKWFGCFNGVFVQSPTGEDQLYHFTSENSPLPDNHIIDMAYDGANGRMYIATAKGVVSIRTLTTKGGNKHNSEIFAYPNPVRPEYEGPIAIKGFARDSNVKITDINGRMVYETKALGGQAIWNGRDYNGRKAASGVYLVFASGTETLEKPDAIVTKILFINGH
ncbi:MAG TPA: hypothetical protein DCQ58_11105 [Saprospirales bacterium]|nr:hypothetical protein [Saprospirales bacterium]